jgi:membrane fusion protein (multidrug efflux system)
MKRETKKQILLASASMLIVTAVLGGVKFIHIRRAIAEHANFTMPPESVTSAIAREVEWTEQWEAVSSLSAVQGVELAAEQAGRVTQIAVESGTKVEKGQLLLALDTAVEEADLKGAHSRVELARQNLTRAANLKTQSALSLATLEEAQSKLRQAEAEAAAIRAVIGKKRILAPFAGLVGIRAVNVGQYVSEGTILLPLYSVHPVYADFSLPQQFVSKVKVGNKVSVSIDSFPGRVFAGEVSAVNPNVDPATRNVSVRATIPNPSEELKPGMFARASVDFGITKKVIVVPTSGVTFAPYGDSVFVIQAQSGDQSTDKKTAKNTLVQLGERRGDLVSVVAGLRVGDEVVSSGGFKLQDQAAVTIHNEKQPGNSESPKVQDS